jgi:hypothetical protein
MKQNISTPSRHHYVRTIFASIFGILALWLVLTSVVVVWLNRTLTDTNIYVKTVAPVVSKPEVQNYFANKLTDQIVDKNPVQDVAAALLPAEQVAGKTPEQLTPAVKAVIADNVKQVLSSTQFKQLWEDTNRSAHQQLLAQLNSGAEEINLDLSPALAGVTEQLKTTQLAPLVDQIDLGKDNAKLNLKGDDIKKVHNSYESFKKATIVLVALGLVMAGLSVAISVHHIKTVRRIAFSTGLGLLVFSLALEVGSLLKFDGGDAAFASALAKTLLHSLLLLSFTLGLVLTIGSIGSKLYAKYHKK